MAKQVWGKHATVATGTNVGSKQVSVDVWNESLNRKGLLGFDSETIASASEITIPADTSSDSSDGTASSFIKLEGVADVDKFIITNTSDGDLLYLITTGSATLVNVETPSVAGQIRLLGNDDKDLSTTVPTILMRVGDYWYEYGGSPVTDGSVTNDQLANMAANTIKVRNANSSGVPSDIALTTTQILIGDGTGFTAASLSGDVSMDNTGDVTVGTLNQSTTGSSASCTGNSATATALATGRTIAMTGDVAWTSESFDGSGNVTATSTIQTDAVDIAMLSATGSAGATTFLRGDNTWATAGGGFGSQQFWCDGGAFIPTPSSVAGTATSYSQTRVLSNGVSVSSVVLPEDATSDSCCTFTWTPPENWDPSVTIVAKIYWTAQEGTAISGDAGFQIAGVAISNGESLNTAFGTATANTDTFLADTDELHIVTMPAIALGGSSPAKADLVQIKVNRDASADTLTAGANIELLGIILQYTQDASTSSG